MTQVEWSELVPDQTETLLAVLLYSEYPKATRVRPSQGDFGIDVLIPNPLAPDTLDVYQIKYFHQSLTTSQKTQIDKSFRRLLIGLVRRGLPLADWYLLMPLDPTVDNLLDWFNEMPDRIIADMLDDAKFTQLEKKEQPLTDTEKAKIVAWRGAKGRIIKWEGRTRCVKLAAEHPYVVDYYVHGGQAHILEAFKDLASVLKTDSSLTNSASSAADGALVTPAELQDHLFTVQRVLDTDPHFRYGISLDLQRPEILVEEDLVAASQVSKPDGRTVTVRIYQRFDEALRERPMPIKVTFLTSDATFDQHAFDMWRKYGMPLIGAPAEVETGLPGGLGDDMSGGVTQVSAMGAVGHSYEVRFRFRRPDGTTGPELLFSLTASTGPEGTGVWETGTDATGLLTFESFADLETHHGSWGFQQGSIVGQEVAKVLPIVEFRQDFCTPNVLQVAQQYGPFADYHDVPEALPVFPASLMEFLRALGTIQTATTTPILTPDLTTVSVATAHAVGEAAALVSGQTVVTAWESMAMAGDDSIPEAGPEQSIDVANEYQLLVFQRFVVKVGGQELLLGTIGKMALSARYSVEGDTVVARPYRNDTMQMWFSPNPDAAGPHDRRVLGRVIGTIDDSAESGTPAIINDEE